MKNVALLIFSLLFTSILYAQNNAIKITNMVTNEVITIEQNTRIRVKTVDGDKYSGLFTIQNDNSLRVDGHLLSLDQIEKIKRHPLLLNLAISIPIVYIGLITTGVGALVAAFSNEPALYALIVPGALITYFGFTGPNPLPAFKIVDDWHYELVNIPK